MLNIKPKILSALFDEDDKRDYAVKQLVTLIQMTTGCNQSSPTGKEYKIYDTEEYSGSKFSPDEFVIVFSSGKLKDKVYRIISNRAYSKEFQIISHTDTEITLKLNIQQLTRNLKSSLTYKGIPRHCILSSLVAKYGSLVDKTDYDYPYFEFADNHIYIYEEKGRDKVFAEVMRTKSGYIVTATKNNKVFEDRTKQTLANTILFIEYIFHIDMDKKDKKLFERLKPEPDRPKDYRKILKIIDNIYLDGLLAQALTDYTFQKAKSEPDLQKLNTLTKVIDRIISPLKKYPDINQFSYFWLDPLSFEVELPKGSSDGLTHSDTIERIYDDIIEEQVTSINDKFKVYDFRVLYYAE